MALSLVTVVVALTLLGGCSACSCYPDWMAIPGSGCYKYVDTPKTFEEAESTCRHFSPGPYGFGHLASVHSTEEYEALASMVPGATDGWNPQVFIGLRLKDGVSPAWTDGSYYDYQNWCGNDPNAHPDGYGAFSGGSYCNGQWVDVHTFTNDQFPFICKLPCIE